MKNKNIGRSLLCLAVLLAVMAGCVQGVNALTAPVVEANRKALLGDAVLIYDSGDPASGELTVTADTVRSIYKDDTKQVYTLHLSTTQGYKPDPIEMTLVVDYEGRIVSLTVDSSGETRELSPEFLPAFVGQDATLADVELVAGVTYSSAAIRNAVSDGFETLVANGLLAEAQKSDEQLLKELIPLVYPGIANKAGAIQGEELAASGSLTGGYRALNDSGCAWFAEADGQKLLAVWTRVGGVKLYDPAGNDVSDRADPALLEEIRSASEANAADLSESQLSTLARLLPEGAEPVAVELPGVASSVVGAWTAETENGVYYAFAVRAYGYGNEIMEIYFVLDENGAVADMRVKPLFIEEEYFPNIPQVDKNAYQEGFRGLTADSYTGEQSLIAGATISSDAVGTGTKDVFEAYALLTADRG